MAQPPKGFVYNQQYGDWENPATGEWFDPGTGQVYPPETPVSGVSSPSQNYGSAIDYASTIESLWPETTEAAASSAASSGASSAATTGAGSAAASGAGYLASQAGGAAAATTFPSAAAAQAAGYTAVGTAANGGVIAVPAASAASGAAGAGGAGAAGTTAGAAGGVSAGAATGIAALIAAQIASTAMGQHDANKQIDKGGAAQQQGYTNLGNAYFTPYWGIHNRVLPAGDVGDNIMASLNPHNPTAPLAMASLLGVNFFSGKDKDQTMRDYYRKSLKKNQFIDDKYNYTLADGSQWDMGRDGSKMLDNIGANIDGKTQRHMYDVDFSDPRAAEAVGALNGLGSIITAGRGDKDKRDITGLLTNAALSSGNWEDNALKMFADAGFNHDSAYGLVHEMSQKKPKEKKPMLAAEDADAYKNALDKLYGVGAYANSGGPKKNIPPPKVIGATAGATPAATAPAMADKPKDTNVIPKAQPVIPRDPPGMYSPKTPKPVTSGAMTALGPKDNNVIPKAPKEAYTLAGTAANLVPTPKVDDRKKQQMVIPRFNSRVPIAAVRGSMQR